VAAAVVAALAGAAPRSALARLRIVLGGMHARNASFGPLPVVSPEALALLLALGSGPARAAPTREPLEVARAFFDALHRHDAKGAAALADGPDAARTLRAFVALSKAHADLEEALRRTFGDEAASQVGWRSRARAEALAFLAARQEVAGDRAVVLAGDDRTIAVLRLRSGSWKVELSEAENLAPGAPELERAGQGASRATEEVERRLRAGAYADAEEAIADWQRRAAKGAAEAPRQGERAL
jgi:hypothetical protein